MTTTACRDVLQTAPRDKGAHAGLLLSRYLRVPVPAKNAQEDSQPDTQQPKHPDDRRELHQAAIQAVQKALPLYQLAYQRRLQDLQQIPSLAHALFTIQGRLIVGLGGESVLETGITLHHTYGVPIIPGSAFKGLASHFCHQVWGAEDSRFHDVIMREQEGQPRQILPQGEYHRALFGAQEDAGYIVFHDAWIEPACLNQQGLVLDVMTPHHSDYYSGTAEKAPTDFDSPNPITFLSVTGRFHIAVSGNACGDADSCWAELALQLLTQALEHWGVGGKTSAGYGRLITLKRQDEGQNSVVVNPTVATQAFKVGDQVTAQRVEDPKGKGRVWFQVENGFGGRVTQGDEPQIEIGASVRLWIASVNQQPPGYNFSSTSPEERGKKQQRGKR